MNFDAFPIAWKKLTRGLPPIREAANDRAPTVEEIRKLIQYPDRRIKAIILSMISGGFRLGAWDYLKWKHVIPLKDENGMSKSVHTPSSPYTSRVQSHFLNDEYNINIESFLKTKIYKNNNEKLFFNFNCY